MLYDKAAKLGNTAALSNLGVYYENGWYVAKNLHIAIEYYKSAAAKNEDIAICNLGLCYKYGRGVGQDASYAKSLFKKAMDLGYEPAKKYYQEM